MKRLKITIKGEGISVKTSDLGMGLSVLNRMVNHGINKHSWVPNALLDRANKVLDAAIKGQEFAKGILKKVKENYKQPEFAPAEEVADEQPTTEVVERPLLEKAKKNKHRSPDMVNQWLLDEDKLICDMIANNVPIKKVIKDKELLKRHTVHAIKTRSSLYKNQKWERLNSDRANVMKAYMSGKRVKTSVANIRRVKQPATPIVDAMEKKVAKGYKGKASGKKSSQWNAWTERELNVVRENPSLTAREISALLPGRTPISVMSVRNKYKMPVDKTGKKKAHNVSAMIKASGQKEWTKDEEQILIDNPDLKGPKLKKLLPGRSYSAVMAKRNKLIKTGILSKKSTPTKAWTKDEVEAIKLNLHMSPKQLSELPWLKGRTISAITVMKSKLKSNRYEA